MVDRLEIEQQEKVYEKITPDLLLPRNKLTDLRERLRETSAWKKLTFAKYEERGIRLSLADLDAAVPFVHHMLGVNGVNLRKGFTGRQNRYLTTEHQLHNASSLFDLLRRGRTNEEEILESFPNSPSEEVIPFVDALSQKDNGIEDVWRQFQKSSGDMDKENFGLGIQLAGNPLEQIVNGDNNYYDVAGVFNFSEFPGEQGTRIQLTSRFGRVRSNRNHRFSFSELKVRNPADIDHANVVQALTKSYLAGHFVDRFFDEGSLERIAEPYIAYGVKGLYPKYSDYELSYRHFNTKSYSLTNIPVEIDYHGDGGLYFLRQWLGFYSDAFNAYKKELRKYLKDGTIPERANIQHELPLVFDDVDRTIFDFSNLPPVSPKKEKTPEEPFYLVGKSMAEENCPTCAQPMTQYCGIRTDIGGPMVIIHLQLECHGHFFSAENKKVRREFLKYKNSDSSENQN